MADRRSPFKQADVTRALRGAVSAGMKPRGYTIGPDGSIYVDFGDGSAIASNSFDRFRALR